MRAPLLSRNLTEAQQLSSSRIPLCVMMLICIRKMPAPFMDIEDQVGINDSPSAMDCFSCFKDEVAD